MDFSAPVASEICTCGSAAQGLCAYGVSRRPICSGSDGWSNAFIAMQQAVTAAGADLDVVMAAVVDGALRILPQATGAVIEMREGAELVYRAASGAAADQIGLRLSIGTSLSGACLAQGQPLSCDDTEIDSRVNKEACRRIGVRSMIVVPLPHRGEAVGVLKVFASAPWAFTQHDVATVQLLAGPVAIGLASATEADAQEARRIADQRFAATFEQAAVGIAHVAPGGRFLLVNDRFCEIAGHSREAMLAGGFQQITHPDDLDADLQRLEDLLAGRSSRYTMEKRYIRQTGEIVWVNLTVSLVRDETGAPEFFVAVVEDISARKAAEAAATHDPLTGLLNRRGFLERLSLELGRHRVAGRALAVAYVDLDGFKAVNDRFGHAEGDRCLVEVAAAMRRVLRADDHIARLGGDEFAVLLPMISQTSTEALADRLHQAVAEVSDGKGWAARASIGVVVVPAGAAVGVSELIHAADSLMYRAKRSASAHPLVVSLS